MTTDLNVYENDPTDTEQVYDYLPEIVTNKITFEQVAQCTKVPTYRVREIIGNFLEDLKLSGNTNALEGVVDRLQESVKTKFLVQAFNNTKRYGVLWQRTLDNTENIDKILQDKIKEALSRHNDEDDEISLKELKLLMALQDKQCKLISAVMKTPMIQSIAEVSKVVVNNNVSPGAVPGGEQLGVGEPKADIVVTASAKYIDPPDVQF